MTFTSLSKTAGRQPITLIHIVMGYCSLTFGDGVPPLTGSCHATIPPAKQKCMNVFNTCPVPHDFQNIGKTFKFCTSTLFVPAGYLPLILGDPDEDATIITPGKGLGKRATVKAKFKDTLWADYGLDKYLDERNYDSFNQATFWKKFRTRNIYFENRPLIIYDGYLEEDGTFDLANFEARYYVISKFNGPDSSGVVSIEGTDEIQLLDKSKVKLPEQSVGKIADWTIGLGVGDFDLSPSGIGDTDYDASGRIAVGKEIMQYTRITDTITITERGSDGTPIAIHKVDDIVQQCIRYENASPSDVLYDLIVTRGGIDASRVDKVAWDAEVLDWLGTFSVTNTLFKPLGVNDLLKNLTAQTMTYIWQEVRTQKIELRVVKPVLDSSTVRDIKEESDIVENSFRIKYLIKDRISDITVLYDLRDFTEDRKDPTNYRNGKRKIDAVAESANAHDKKSIKEIFGEWIPVNGAAQALVVGSRLLDKNVDPPTLIQFAMDKKDDDVKVGDIVNIFSDELINENGIAEPKRFQILSKNDKKQGTTNAFLAEEFQFASRYGLITPDEVSAGVPFPDYVASSPTQREQYMYVCQNDGLYSNNDAGKVFI